jgi:hypothetical protein
MAGDRFSASGMNVARRAERPFPSGLDFLESSAESSWR